MKKNKKEHERLKDTYINLDEQTTEKAIQKIDYSDESIYLWATRKDRFGFLQRFKSFKDKSKGVRKYILWMIFPIIILIDIISPILIAIFLSSVSLTLVSSIVWVIYNYTWPIIHLIYLVLHLIWTIKQGSIPIRMWYKNTISGRPTSSSYTNISTYIYKMQWIKVFSSIYIILLFVAFVSPSQVVGDFHVYKEMLLFNIDVISNAILFGLPEALYGNFSNILVQSWQGKLLVAGLKFMIVGGIIAGFSIMVNRIRQPNSDFIGTAESLTDYLVSYYRTELSRVSVMKVGKFEKSSKEIIPGYFFTISRSVRSDIQESYPGAGGRDFRNVMREVSKAGLKRNSNA